MKKKPAFFKASNLIKSYQDRNVVDEISFEVSEGEVVGLLGPNGAGKTTAFYMAIGLIRPDRGSVEFQGEDITKLGVDQRAKKGMGYLAQEPSVFRGLTVEENILCFLETLNISSREKKQQLEELLEELNLQDLASRKAHLLSGGERRRLEITRALVTKPKLLLLDEPFANVDPITVYDLKLMIRMLKRKKISILITDHNAREIFSVIDRSYLMIKGRMLASGSTQELIENEEVRKQYLGDSFEL